MLFPNLADLPTAEENLVQASREQRSMGTPQSRLGHQEAIVTWDKMFMSLDPQLISKMKV